MVIPNCCAICRICAMSSAGGRSPRPDGAALVSASNGWIRSGSAFGVTFWPMPPFGLVPGAPPRPPPKPPKPPPAAFSTGDWLK